MNGDYVHRQGFRLAISGGICLAFSLLIPFVMETTGANTSDLRSLFNVGMVLGGVGACFGLGMLFISRNENQDDL